MIGTKTNSNLEKVIKQAVYQELVDLLEVEPKPEDPKKGKTKVVMFVGL